MSSTQGNLIREIWHYFSILAGLIMGSPASLGVFSASWTRINQRQESLPHAGPIIVHCR